MFYVLKRHTNENQNKFLELKNALWEIVILIMKSPEEFEIESIAKGNAITYREKSPFGRHYELKYNKSRSFINDNEKDYEITKSKSNICFSPGIIEFVLTYYMPLLPLWSGIILSRMNNKENSTTTDSDTSVENWLRIVKHSILNSE